MAGLRSMGLMPGRMADAKTASTGTPRPNASSGTTKIFGSAFRAGASNGLPERATACCSSAILEAVREGAGDRMADLIADMKKAKMVEEAERLLADTGWLPEPLRLAGSDADQAVEPSADGDGGDEAALPDFLAGDDDEDAADDGASSEEPEHLVAAE